MKEKEYKNLISCGWNAKYKENLKRSMKKKKKFRIPHFPQQSVKQAWIINFM